MCYNGCWNNNNNRLLYSLTRKPAEARLLLKSSFEYTPVKLLFTSFLTFFFYQLNAAIINYTYQYDSEQKLVGYNISWHLCIVCKFHNKIRRSIIPYSYHIPIKTVYETYIDRTFQNMKMSVRTEYLAKYVTDHDITNEIQSIWAHMILNRIFKKNMRTTFSKYQIPTVFFAL